MVNFMLRIYHIFLKKLGKVHEKQQEQEAFHP